MTYIFNLFLFWHKNSENVLVFWFLFENQSARCGKVSRSHKNYDSSYTKQWMQTKISKLQPFIIVSYIKKRMGVLTINNSYHSLKFPSKVSLRHRNTSDGYWPDSSEGKGRVGETLHLSRWHSCQAMAANK